MISTQKAVLKLILLGALGGWLGGACVNASGDLLKGLVHVNALKGMLAGSLTHIFLAIPWIFSINSFEKLSVRFERPILKWGSEFLGAGFGVIGSILTVYLFFLFWPYEAHGRYGAYKTVIAIVGTSSLAIVGVGGLVGVYASSWIRPKQEQSNTLIDIGFPVMILGGLIGIVGTNTRGMETEEIVITPESRECCSVAYQAFVGKVGVSYAVFEAEKYCDNRCPLVSECIDTCEVQKNDCSSNDKNCKDSYRECVQNCPNIVRH